MTQVTVLTPDERLVDALKTSGLRAVAITHADLATYLQKSDAPPVLVADLRGQEQLPSDVVTFRRKHPGSGVVLVLSSFDPRIMLEAMRAGVTECVAEPLSPKQLDEAVRRVLTNVVAHPTGQVFAFIGAKGGVGTSTLAVNTAVALGVNGNASSLMVELHTTHGDAALFLGVEPRFSVLDALDNVHRVDESFFGGVVEKAAGVHLLASPNRPRPGVIDAKRFRALLEAAARMYSVTVLDIPRSDLSTIDCLDTATSIVVVTSQEIASLRNAGKLAEMLRGRYGAPRVKVVVNRFHREAVIAQEDVERVVGTKVKAIPSDYKVALEALNGGRPLVLDTDSRLAKALVSLSRELAGVKKEKAEAQAGVLGRLAWRRA